MPVRASGAEQLFYSGRIAALATKHEKQRALAGPLLRSLGIKLIVPASLDTDTLGTFTGEVERTGTAAEVALRKARLGMEALNLDLGLASEGSFGPHPFMPFASSGLEILIFVDDAEGYSVMERILTPKTNFAHLECATLSAAEHFAAGAGFPKHALIVRPVGNADPALIKKGIVSRAGLASAFARAIEASHTGRVSVETDMRAHMNPTRMGVLRQLGKQLARRLRNHCTRCKCPGFGLVGVERGLPCEVCREPTEMLRHEIHGCPRCDQKHMLPRSDGRTSASPQYCPDCNP